MSGQGQVLGATTTAGAGIAVLPNTGGNVLLIVFAWLAITAGVAVLGSALVSRLLARASH